MRKGPIIDRKAESFGLWVVLTVVSLAGAVMIGLIVLSYNDPHVNDGLPYYVELGPVVKDSSVEGRYKVMIDSKVGTPFSAFELEIDGHISKVSLDRLIGIDAAWHIDGMVVYIDDANGNGLCDRGDSVVVISDMSGPSKEVDMTVRSVQYGMKLASVHFTLEGAAEDDE
ncbi:MAG: hypothetical protein HPY73_05245 [Methanomassiliicoccales archaeon]|nr:MAG: hypothetical protein HPY73_05245 [Methanomassiliicoccales archaeon]